MQEPPMLNLLDNKGKFYLCSDTNKLLQEALFIKYKLVNQNWFLMQVNECLSQQRIILL